MPFMPGFRKPRIGRQLTYVGKVQAFGNSGAHSFTAVPIGAPAANRLVIVAVVNSHGSVTGITIGGTAATDRVHAVSGGWNDAAIYTLPVASGSTADIVITTNGTDVLNAYIYSATGLTSATPTGTSASTGNFSEFQTTVNVSAGGIIIGCMSDWNSTNNAAQIYTTSNALQTVDEAATYYGGTNYWATYAAHSVGLSANAAYPVWFEETGAHAANDGACLAAWV